MAIVFEDRPEREPDVIIPAIRDFCQVEVWVEEKRFFFRGDMHNTIASSALGIDETDDAIVYMTGVVDAYDNGATYLRERVEPIMMYFLEKEVLGKE